MKRKYFFFDIDGTLTDRATGKMVPSAAEAVKKLQAAGHFVSIATGRAFYKAEAFRKTSPFENMVCNGGHGLVVAGELRENRPLELEKAKAVAREAEALGYGVLFTLDDSTRVYTKDFRFYEQAGLRREPTVYIIDPDLDLEKLDPIWKMYISIPEAEEGRLSTLNTLGHLRFHPPYLMFQPDEKREGILRMLEEYTEGKPEDVVVFGDDYNDLCMFDPRFFGVAMGNACEALKEKADYVTRANVEDGIYAACESQGWFEPVSEEPLS